MSAFRFLLLLLLLPSPARPCSCATRPVCDRIQGAQFAVLGVAVQTFLSTTPVTRFQVQEVLKGSLNNNEVLIASSTFCMAHFNNGESYLVYAYRDKSQPYLVTDVCSGNSIDRDVQAEIALLREFRSKGRVQGVIGSLEGPQPIDGIPVTAQSASGTWKAITDQHGLFRFPDLPRTPYGVYYISAAVSPASTLELHATIVNGCDALGLRSPGSSKLYGTLSAAAQPIPRGDQITLLDPTTKRVVRQVWYSAVDNGGHFEMP